MDSCFFCDSKENLNKCPSCGKTVCADDLFLIHPCQLSFQWNGRPPNYMKCLECRLGSLLTEDTFTEKVIVPDEGVVHSAGTLYIPSPLSTRSFADLAQEMKSVQTSALKPLANLFEARAQLAKHLMIFNQTRSFIVSSERNHRISELSKKEKRSLRREEQGKPIHATSPKQKFVDLSALVDILMKNPGVARKLVQQKS